MTLKGKYLHLRKEVHECGKFRDKMGLWLWSGKEKAGGENLGFIFLIITAGNDTISHFHF